MQMFDDEVVSYTLVELDDDGNIASPDATPPVWSVEDASILSVVAAADGLSAVLSAVGNQGGSTGLGTSSFTVTTANGITGTDSITVAAAGTAVVQLTPGTPSHK